MKQWMWIMLLAVYAAAIGYLSHQPLGVGEAPFPHYDKLFHLVEFALFFFLCWRATGQRLLVAWIMTLAFAIGDEYHQAFVPTRVSSLPDFIADGAGASLMAGILHYRQPLWRVFDARILGRRSSRGR